MLTAIAHAQSPSDYAQMLMRSGNHSGGIGLFGSEVQLLGDAGTTIWGLIAAASSGVSAYHGYKRNNGSIGWAIGWGLLGGLFPVIVPAVAFAQGIGEKK
jgi:hypothetical protein